LASHLPVGSLVNTLAQVRLQIWHKVLLPGTPPVPYGLLLYVRPGSDMSRQPVYQTGLAPSTGNPMAKPPLLAVDLGGRMSLEFYGEKDSLS
jgi:hypothetical protein